MDSCFPFCPDYSYRHPRYSQLQLQISAASVAYSEKDRTFQKSQSRVENKVIARFQKLHEAFAAIMHACLSFCRPMPMCPVNRMKSPTPLRVSSNSDTAVIASNAASRRRISSKKQSCNASPQCCMLFRAHSMRQRQRLFLPVCKFMSEAASNQNRPRVAKISKSKSESEALYSLDHAAFSFEKSQTSLFNTKPSPDLVKDWRHPHQSDTNTAISACSPGGLVLRNIHFCGSSKANSTWAPSF